MDDIQRKLDLIDKQLAGRPNFLQRAISTSPLAIVALGLDLTPENCAIAD
jgi:hypothetical protein